MEVKYLVVSFPFSNAALLQYFPGETAECVTEGLQAIWQRIGGVPSRVVFDNAISGLWRFLRHYCGSNRTLDFQYFSVYYQLRLRIIFFRRNFTNPLLLVDYL